MKTYFVSKFDEFKKLGPKYDSTITDLEKKFGTYLVAGLKNMGVEFLGDLIKIIMGLDPTEVSECKLESISNCEFHFIESFRS